MTAVHAVERLPDDHTLWPEAVFRWSYGLLATPDEMAALDTLAGEARSRYLAVFWKRRDPTPTTDENEFKVQFEDRVDYARTRFSVRSQPEPWDRRGEIWIRFGPPDDRIDSSFDANYEKWYYFNQNLKFMFQGGTEGQRLVPFVEFSGRVQSLPEYNDYRVRMEQKGVVYSPPPGEIRIELAFDWYPFRRADGRYDVYFACGVPMHAIAKHARDRTHLLDYTARVIAFDSVLQSRWTDSISVRTVLDDVPDDMRAQSEWHTVMPPGFYVVAAELDDRASSKRAVSAFDRWLVPYEQSVELDLSPLVVAARIRSADSTSGRFVRNDREIIPMAGNVFKKDQDVAFYHEVYNLQRDSAGVCHYRIEYALYNTQREERRVLVSREYRSGERDTFQAGTIPRSEIKPGSYILEVVTTDLVGLLTKTALTSLKIE